MPRGCVCRRRAAPLQPWWPSHASPTGARPRCRAWRRPRGCSSHCPSTAGWPAVNSWPAGPSAGRMYARVGCAAAFFQSSAAAAAAPQPVRGCSRQAPLCAWVSRTRRRKAAGVQQQAREPSWGCLLLQVSRNLGAALHVVLCILWTAPVASHQCSETDILAPAPSEEALHPVQPLEAAMQPGLRCRVAV